MEWGYRTEDGSWDMPEESTVPVSEDGFFYFALPKEEYGERMDKGMRRYSMVGDRLRYGIGVKYLESRNVEGEVIYQKWMTQENWWNLIPTNKVKIRRESHG